MNAFESVLCGKGVSVEFFDFGRSSNFTVVTAFLGMLGHVCRPPLCVLFVAWGAGMSVP